MFNSVFENGYTVGSTMLAFVVSLACGVLVSFAYTIKNDKATRSLLVSFVLLPLITQGVVMMIHGEGGSTELGIGAGLAIAGAFNLVRFRSIPGNAWDITSVFLAMGAGISTGLGHIYFALVLTAIACAVFIIVKYIPFKILRDESERELRITIPEDLDYTTEFEPIFKEFARSTTLRRVNTTKMGSLFVLRYIIKLKDTGSEMQLINALRIKNSNLPISCSRLTDNTLAEEL